MASNTVSSKPSKLQTKRKPMNSADGEQTGMNILKKIRPTSSFTVNTCCFVQESPLIPKIISNGPLDLTSQNHKLAWSALLILSLPTLINKSKKSYHASLEMPTRDLLKPLHTPSNHRLRVFHLPQSHDGKSYNVVTS